MIIFNLDYDGKPQDLVRENVKSDELIWKIDLAVQFLSLFHCFTRIKYWLKLNCS